MINSEKMNRGLQAIHDLIIECKILAYSQQSHEQIGDLLNHVEYLPMLILDKSENTELFESYLKEVCEQNEFKHVWIRYSKE